MPAFAGRTDIYEEHFHTSDSKAFDVADIYGACAVALAMRADSLNGSALVDGAIAVDDKVIADVAPTFALNVPLTDLPDDVILVLRGGGAISAFSLILHLLLDSTPCEIVANSPNKVLAC